VTWLRSRGCRGDSRSSLDVRSRGHARARGVSDGLQSAALVTGPTRYSGGPLPVLPGRASRLTWALVLRIACQHTST